MAAYEQVVKFEIREIDDTYQADLVDMKAYSNVNHGYKYLLTAIDVFLEFRWALALKNKSGQEVTSTISSKRKAVRNIQLDLGSGFYCQPFQNLKKEHEINLYSTFSNLKASICER